MLKIDVRVWSRIAAGVQGWSVCRRRFSFEVAQYYRNSKWLTDITIPGMEVVLLRLACLYAATEWASFPG